MKRDTIFKAKSLDDGEWVEGDLVHYVTDTCIRVERLSHSVPIAKLDYIDIEVDPATVCQLTGVLDSNGANIFEGDILNKSYIVTYDAPAFKQRLIDFANSQQYQTAPIYNHQTVTGNRHDSEATK